jgi:hypothetical protein
MLITTPPAIPLDWLPLPVNPFIPAIQVSLPTPMPAPEFLATLDRLIHACPDIWLDKRTMKVCLDELSNIPAGFLRHFASQHICTSPYFPCISGQHLIARQLSGTANFASLSSPVVDYLELQAFRVSNFCFQHGELAPYEWHRLARLLENVGHSCWAEGLYRQRYTLQQVRAACITRHECPSPEDRRLYRPDETHSDKKGFE